MKQGGGTYDKQLKNGDKTKKGKIMEGIKMKKEGKGENDDGGRV